MHIIKYDGLTLTLHGDAYLDYDTYKGAHYTTLAHDNIGNSYRVSYILPDDESSYSEPSDFIHWDKPDYIEPLNNDEIRSN